VQVTDWYWPVVCWVLTGDVKQRLLITHSQWVRPGFTQVCFRNNILQPLCHPTNIVKLQRHVLMIFSLSLCFNGQFLGEPGLAGFIGAKDDWSGGDNWSYKTYINSSQIITTNKQTLTFYRADALPVVKPTVSKHWGGKCINDIDD